MKTLKRGKKVFVHISSTSLEMGTSYFLHHAAVILSKEEESERASIRTLTTRSEDLPKGRVEIVGLTRA